MDFLIGARRPRVIEPLTTVREYPVQWRKLRLDLAELAKLRWIEGWSTERLAKYYSKSPNAIKLYYGVMKKKDYHLSSLTEKERITIKWALRK